MELLQVAQIGLATLLTIFVYSFLHSENPTYRAAEHLFIGAAAGHYVLMGIKSINKIAVVPMLEGNLLFLIPIILGIMMFSTMSKKYSWLSRYPIALIVGVGAGLSLRATPRAQILSQIMALSPLLAKNTFTTLNLIIIWIGTVSVITYFYMTREHSGVLKVPTTIGKYILLAAFGATYGGVVLERLAPFIGRVKFLIAPDTYIATAVALVVTVALMSYSITREKRNKVEIKNGVE